MTIEGIRVRDGIQGDEWLGAYKGSWASLISPESFSHP